MLRFPPLRPYQTSVLTSDAQDTVVISAPQLGKTVLARLWLLGRAWQHGPDDRVWWWTAPTYQQVRHGFNGFVRYADSAGLVDSYTTTTPLVCRLNIGVEVHALSWDNPQGMYGPTVLGGVSDEFGWMTASAYSAISSRRAETIAQSLGSWLWIGNVGNIGGAAEDLWKLAEAESHGFRSYRWTWRDRLDAHPCSCGKQNGQMASSMGTDQAIETYLRHPVSCPKGVYSRFIRSERERMSRAQFAQLYDAEWADWNELPVYSFDRQQHVNAERAEYQPDLPILLSCDFNVDPMVWTLGQAKGDTGWTFDEIVIPGGATTVAACEEFLRRYPHEKTDVRVYGDRSGKSRDTKSKVTDYDQIRTMLGGHYLHFELDVPSANPPVASRVNAVNAKLENGRLYIHPRCTTLIEDRARVSWKPGTREIDKSNKSRTHASDADDYRWARLFEVRAEQPVYVGTASSSAPLRDPFLGQVF